MRPTLRPSHLVSAALAMTAAWSASAEPAMAYIDPTAAGAFMQSMYVLLASAVLFVAALPHKVAAFVQGVKAKFGAKPTGAAPDQEP